MEPLFALVTSWLDNTTIQKVIQFFQQRLTIIDFIIIGLGTFLLVYQVWIRLTSSAKRFARQVQQSPLFLREVELKIRYVNTLIEILPILGILGTVWGLMSALYVIQEVRTPTIADIAANIAPALSTTFLGLLFSVLNLFIANFVQVYLFEIMGWCQLTLGTSDSVANIPSGAKREALILETIHAMEASKKRRFTKELLKQLGRGDYLRGFEEIMRSPETTKHQKKKEE